MHVQNNQSDFLSLMNFVYFSEAKFYFLWHVYDRGTNAHVYAGGKSRQITVIAIPIVVSGILFCLVCYCLHKKTRKSDKAVLRENCM